MALIQPVAQPARWFIASENLDGITNVGDATGVAEALTVLYAEGEAEFLAATADEAGDYNPLPEQGQWCEANTIYSHNGSFVICRQSHFRTEHAPADVPALFAVYRAEAGDLEWIAGEPVSVGTRRTYNGTLYTRLQAHQTQSDWTPPAVPALWAVVAEAGASWAAYVDYSVGAIVTYNGTDYECIQAHQSLPNWTPDATPTLWRVTAPPTAEWRAWTAYKIGDHVLYQTVEYVCIQAHTSQPTWTPPVVPALWKKA